MTAFLRHHTGIVAQGQVARRTPDKYPPALETVPDQKALHEHRQKKLFFHVERKETWPNLKQMQIPKNFEMNHCNKRNLGNVNHNYMNTLKRNSN